MADKVAELPASGDIIVTRSRRGEGSPRARSQSIPRRNRIARLCSTEKCNLPAYGLAGKCPDCTAIVKSGSFTVPCSTTDVNDATASTPVNQPKVGRSRNKRNAASLSPSFDENTTKKVKSTLDYDSLLAELDSLDRVALISKLRDSISAERSAVGELQRVSSELAELKTTFDQYKIAFADNAFRALIKPDMQQNVGVNCATSPRYQSSTIVLDINDDSSKESFDAKRLDSILDSKAGGPVAETITRTDKKVYVSFKDALESGKAADILETKPECIKMFKSVSTKPKFFSLVALHADISDIQHLEEELLLRNSYFEDSLKRIIPVYKSKSEPSVGHVKLLFSSARIRDAALARGKVFAAGRRLIVVETDLNKEVRRCFRCQRYGHIAKVCKADHKCGRCAKPHDTKLCNSPDALKCVNCSKSHRSGDPVCPEQVKAVKRLRTFFEQ